MKYLMIAALALFATAAEAREKLDSAFTCGNFKINNVIVNDAPKVSIREYLVEVGPMLPAFSHKWVLTEKTTGWDRVTTDYAMIEIFPKVPMRTGVQTFEVKNENGQAPYHVEVARNRESASVLVPELGWVAHCKPVTIDESEAPRNPESILQILTAEVTNNLGMRIWAGAWSPKVTSVEILKSYKKDGKQVYLIEALLYFKGPRQRTSTMQFEAQIDENGTVTLTDKR